MNYRILAPLWLAGLACLAQTTKVDLRTQTQNVDFTQAAFTRPVKSGTALPATCTIGDLFYKTDALPAGQNLYGCTAVNTWTLQGDGGAGGGAVSSVTGTANQVTVSPSTGAVVVSLPANVDLSAKTSFRLPSSAAPVTDAAGKIASDNNAWATGRGALQGFDGTANTYVVAALASDVPLNGQVPMWNNGGTITWETVSGGGGAGALGDLSDLRVTLSGSTYTISAGKSAFGDVTVAFNAATLVEADPDDSGTVYFCAEYNNGSPRMVAVIPAAFSEANYTPAGLTLVDGTGCPEESRVLATAPMTAGTAGAPVEFRPVATVAPTIVAGAGLLKAVTDSGRARTLSVDSATVVRKFSGAGVPGSIGGSTLGDLYIDTSAEKAYVCLNAGGACNGVAAGQWVILN